MRLKITFDIDESVEREINPLEESIGQLVQFDWNAIKIAQSLGFTEVSLFRVAEIVNCLESENSHPLLIKPVISESDSSSICSPSFDSTSSSGYWVSNFHVQPARGRKIQNGEKSNKNK